MAADVRIVYDKRAIDSLGADIRMAALLSRVAEPIVREAQARAPKRTGKGAESIHAEATTDPGVKTRQRVRATHISWDRDHFYMYFHEKGTQQLPARPFLVRAVRTLKKEGFEL